MFVAVVAAKTRRTLTGKTVPAKTFENVTDTSLFGICTNTFPVPPIYNARQLICVVSLGVTAVAALAGKVSLIRIPLSWPRAAANVAAPIRQG